MFLFRERVNVLPNLLFLVLVIFNDCMIVYSQTCILYCCGHVENVSRTRNERPL